MVPKAGPAEITLLWEEELQALLALLWALVARPGWSFLSSGTILPRGQSCPPALSTAPRGSWSGVRARAHMEGLWGPQDGAPFWSRYQGFSSGPLSPACPPSLPFLGVWNGLEVSHHNFSHMTSALGCFSVFSRCFVSP